MSPGPGTKVSDTLMVRTNPRRVGEGGTGAVMSSKALVVSRVAAGTPSTPSSTIGSVNGADRAPRSRTVHCHGTRRSRPGRLILALLARPGERLATRNEFRRKDAGHVAWQIAIHLEDEFRPLHERQRQARGAGDRAEGSDADRADQRRLIRARVVNGRGDGRDVLARTSPGCSGSERTSSQTRSAIGHCAGCSRGERRLARDRDRVVDQRLDAARLQVRLQRGAIAASGSGTGDRRGRDRARRGTRHRRAGAGGGGTRPASARRSSVQRGQPRSRARRIAACISSSREFTPNSP